jgi:hypothetical protein
VQVSAAAAAEARAAAAALAIAEAEASARAFAAAVASARASAESSASAIAAAGASINATTIGDCCRTGGFCPVVPPPTQHSTITVRAQCQAGTELTGVPIHLTAPGFSGTIPTPFQRTFPQGTQITLQAPSTWNHQPFLYWQHSDGRTFSQNPITAVLQSTSFTLIAVYKSCG